MATSETTIPASTKGPVQYQTPKTWRKQECNFLVRRSMLSLVYRIAVLSIAVVTAVVGSLAALVVTLQSVNTMQFADPEIPPDLIVNQVYGSALLCISCLTVLAFIAIASEMIFITLRYVNYRAIVEIFSDEFVHESKLDEYDHIRFDADARVAFAPPIADPAHENAGTPAGTGVIEFTEAPTLENKTIATNDASKNALVTPKSEKAKTSTESGQKGDLMEEHSFVTTETRRPSKLQIQLLESKPTAKTPQTDLVLRTRTTIETSVNQPTQAQSPLNTNTSGEMPASFTQKSSMQEKP